MSEATYFSFEELLGYIDERVGNKVSKIFQEEYGDPVSAAVTTAALLVTVILANATFEDGNGVEHFNEEDARFNIKQILTFIDDFADKFIKDQKPKKVLS